MIMNILRKGCLGLLILAGSGAIALTVALAIALNLYFQPKLRSTHSSPDGRFKVEIFTDPVLFAMPGQGSDASGMVYLYDTTGQKIAQKSFPMLQLVQLNWTEDELDLGLGVGMIDLPVSHDPNIQLFQAVMEGNRPRFDKLFAKANPQFITANGRTLLHAAAHSNNLEIIKILLQKNIDINAKDNLGDTALHLAVQNNLPKITQILLENKANPNSQSQDQDTPLLTALEREFMPIAQQLIQYNADVNVINRNQKTPLHFAARLSDLELIRELIKRGASPQLQPSPVSILSTVLDHSTTSTPQKQQTIAFLLSQGTQLDDAILIDAINWRQFDMVEFLIQKGANVNAQEVNSTPLIAIVSSAGATPAQRQRIMDLLLAAGADINGQNEWGDTPLSTAALHYSANPDQSTIQYLLQQSADVNLANQYGTTPLMLAAQVPVGISTAQRSTLVNLLLKQGADRQAQNQQGKTAADLALDPQIQKLLRP
jgi:ankyrin repeat protein